MRIIPTDIPEQVKNTEALLYAVSNHLSNVRGCRKVEYEVTVTTSGDMMQIKLNPGGIQIPIWGRGKSATRVDVLYHILAYHLWTGKTPKPLELGEFEIPPGYFVNGIYKYILSPSGKVRRWQAI